MTTVTDLALDTGLYPVSHVPIVCNHFIWEHYYFYYYYYNYYYYYYSCKWLCAHPSKSWTQLVRPSLTSEGSGQKQVRHRSLVFINTGSDPLNQHFNIQLFSFNEESIKLLASSFG